MFSMFHWNFDSICLCITIESLKNFNQRMISLWTPTYNSSICTMCNIYITKPKLYQIIPKNQNLKKNSNFCPTWWLIQSCHQWFCCTPTFSVLLFFFKTMLLLSPLVTFVFHSPTSIPQKNQPNHIYPCQLVWLIINYHCDVSHDSNTAQINIYDCLKCKLQQTT